MVNLLLKCRKVFGEKKIHVQNFWLLYQIPLDFVYGAMSNSTAIVSGTTLEINDFWIEKIFLEGFAKFGSAAEICFSYLVTECGGKTFPSEAFLSPSLVFQSLNMSKSF